MSLTETSKFLSYVLRHAPESIGVALDGEGWVSVDELIEKARAAGKRIDLATLREVVETNDKKRFTLSDNGARIRAAQGHSVEVDTVGDPVAPPAVLFHGTATRFLKPILEQGLKPMNRRHVHLSAETETAKKVGMRYGVPVILRVDAGAMHAAGQPFYRADNGVWLTGPVAPAYLSRDEAGSQVA
ncbi:MAG: RNA 2'-phosphotransferase [Ahrensia sp.]|nr:RNA 2'-phosphotransferase [Ahrensia sp.]